MAMTAEQRAMRARVAALTRWANEDPAEQMRKARAKFDERFEKQVDPEGILPEAERIRRAQAARRSYYQQLAFKSSRARSR